MGFRRKHLLKYILIISYVLKSCFNRTKSQNLLKILFRDLKAKILFGSEIAFKCLPENILEKLVTNCYDDNTIIKNSLQINKCLFISQKKLNELKLKNLQWILVNVKTTGNNCLPVLHYNRIVVLHSFNESECLLTSTNLFNICNCDHTCQVLMLRIIKPLIEYEPQISLKVSISIIKPLVFKENTQILIDEAIQNYFSLPKCVSVGDMMKLDLNKCYPEIEYLVKLSDSSMTYIKIIEIEGINSTKVYTQPQLYNCKSSLYTINSRTKLIEVKYLTNTYLPMEKEYGINNLNNLNVNNYEDFLLNVFPDGMNDEVKQLVSWIKPFVQQKRSGDNHSHFSNLV